MDEQLFKEMEHILNSNDDPELQGKSLSRVLVYLLTLPVPNQSSLSLFKRFLLKSYEILPSSNLPDQFSKKIGIPIKRRRLVSFSNCFFFKLPSDKILSPEGEEQKKRENGQLGMNNTDINRKFIPRKQLENGFKNETKEISIIESLLINSYLPEKLNTINPKKFIIPKITVKDLLENCNRINELKSNN